MATQQTPAPAPAIKVASAPVSWGIMESVETPAEYPYTRVLDEIKQAGFAGTELGPYGYLPADAQQLRAELQKRGLALCSAFIAFELAEASALAKGLEQVRRTAKLISAAGATHIVLSDEITPERSAVAGRRDEANRLSWKPAQWQTALSAVRAVIEACREFGLAVAFHHHVGSHVETPEEIDHLLGAVPARDFGLCLDTGHYYYGGGDPAEFVEKSADSVQWLHLKDADPKRLAEARDRKLDFHAGVRHGVFAPLGQGAVDFARVLAALGKQGYRGWAVVEQDVLPGGAGMDAPVVNATAARQYLRQFGI
jgi:inosose dehydratase